MGKKVLIVNRAKPLYISRFRAVAVNAQSIPKDVTTIINWESTDFDTLDEIDLNNNRFIPKRPGYYLITFIGAISNLAIMCIVWAFIYKNTDVVGAVITPRTAGVYSISTPVLAIIYLDGVSDYIQVKMKHSSDGNENTMPSYMHFSGHRLS